MSKGERTELTNYEEDISKTGGDETEEIREKIKGKVINSSGANYHFSLICNR